MAANSKPFTCPLCSETVQKSDTTLHIAESHSDLNKFVRGGLTEAEYLNNYFSSDKAGEDDDEQEETPIPALSALEELGIKMEDIPHADVTTETGAVMTPSEAKRVMDVVEEIAGFRIDRAAFIVNFVDWGIRNGFTEELVEAGGFTLISHNTEKHAEKYFKVSTLHNMINEALSSAGTGRSFTFRRFGRYLAKSIPTIVEMNEKLKRFYVDGSPMSNRFGVPAANFLAVTSIFEYIKPYNKWTRGEKLAWMAHNRSVTKPSNENTDETLPTDLRIAPAGAMRLIENNRDDYSRRHADYGKGKNLFEKMLSETSNPRSEKEGLGYSDMRERRG